MYDGDAPARLLRKRVFGWDYGQTSAAMKRMQSKVTRERYTRFRIALALCGFKYQTLEIEWGLPAGYLSHILRGWKASERISALADQFISEQYALHPELLRLP